MMRICSEHWAALRKAIEDRGLSHLVARSGEEAVGSMVRQIEGTDTKADFDPLMNANWAICRQYLKDVGLSGMGGDKCPLCEVEKSRAGLAANWITGAADDQLAGARYGNLVPAQQ